MSDEINFFHFQDRALGVLWGWGLGNLLAGAATLLSSNLVLRHAGLQALSWGAIDAGLAFFGRRSARAHMRRGSDSLIQARRFRAILLINCALDAGYIAGGWALVRRANGRGARAGSGLGIVLQGVFLLLFDTALAWLTGQWTRQGER